MQSIAPGAIVQDADGRRGRVVKVTVGGGLPDMATVAYDDATAPRVRTVHQDALKLAT